MNMQNAFELHKIINPKYILLWDVDGTINFNHLLSNKNHIKNLVNDYIFYGKNLPTSINKYPEIVAHYNENLKDIYIPKYHFFKIAFDILCENQILCILGTNRLIYPIKYFYEGKKIKSLAQQKGKKNMYKAFDDCFGKKRHYLNQETAEMLLLNYNNDSEQNPELSKTLFMKKTHLFFPNLAKEKIVLVDDQEIIYRKDIEDLGYSFIPAKIDLSHIAQVLLKFVRKENILIHLEKIKVHNMNSSINDFQNFIFNYLKINELEIIKWQANIK